MSTKMSQADAIAALGDLLDDLPSAPKPIVRPLWIPSHITVIEYERTCTNCKTTYRDVSPRLLLTEQHTRREDKKRSTSSLRLSDEELSALPWRTEIIVQPSIPCCISCVRNSNTFSLARILHLQAEQDRAAAANAIEAKKLSSRSRAFTPDDKVPEPENEIILDDPVADLSDLFEGGEA